MIPSRYMLIDERSPYPVKRRVKGRGDDRDGQPAITLLPPDPYMIMNKPEFVRTPSPTMYRTVPPKSAKNKEASSFVILGDTIHTPVQSRPGSPSGRVSPFRGRGFKSPTTTRPNSRAPSPSDSPKRKPIASGKTEKPPVNVTGNRSRIGRDIGLPPKSPMKVTKAKTPTAETTAEKVQETEKEKGESEAIEGDVIVTEDKEEKFEESKNEEENVTEVCEGEKQETAIGSEDENKNKMEEEAEKESEIPETVKDSSTDKQRLTAANQLKQRERTDKRMPSVSPTPKTKTEKNESNTQQKQTVAKKSTKPPLPPKKIGLRATLKAHDPEEKIKKVAKEVMKTKTNGKETSVKEKEKPAGKDSKPAEKKTGESSKQTNSQKTTESESAGKPESEKKSEKEVEKSGNKRASSDENSKNPGAVKTVEGSKKAEGSVTKVDEKTGSGEKQTEKIIPCFQPDKCQIAPPTMASPSPIITPTISTPSTSADLASSSMKSSQSIAAAPTTVTSSSLSSVSSTVVLTGNLARKEIDRVKSKEASRGSDVKIDIGKPETNLVGAKETNGSAAVDLTSSQMVKAGSKDSIKWSNKEALSGEITSATKVIKAEPDMEVLSPNNLRDLQPGMPPPNLAWDEERLPNGDVPNKTGKEGKFRRFISAVWRFLSYLFCCRCSRCCRKEPLGEIPKPSIFSKLNCCRGCSCRECCCGSGCCRGCCKTCCSCDKAKCCDGSRCCGKKAKPKPKEKSKPKKCCAKPNCSCKDFCDKVKNQCLNCRDRVNSLCRSLFCLNMMCCQRYLRKCKYCHTLKCCQKNGLFSCCNPYVKKEPRKLHKKGSHASNHSRDKDQVDPVLVEHTSLMKAAIPVLPTCLAVFCLILNLFVPGFGTFISGILCLCFGKPRFSTKDSPKNRMGSFIVNTIIAVAQLFTVVFCLVGWGWSIWWGVIMYKLSRRQKRLKLAEKNQKEAEGSNVNHNHVDVEQG